MINKNFDKQFFSLLIQHVRNVVKKFSVISNLKHQK